VSIFTLDKSTGVQIFEERPGVLFIWSSNKVMPVPTEMFTNRLLPAIELAMANPCNTDPHTNFLKKYTHYLPSGKFTEKGSENYYYVGSDLTGCHVHVACDNEDINLVRIRDGSNHNQLFIRKEEKLLVKKTSMRNLTSILCKYQGFYVRLIGKILERCTWKKH
jgi:hypothetical protein